MLFFLALALSVATPVEPLRAPEKIEVPISVERTKFPNSDPILVDRVAFINKLVNAAMTYVDDQAHYGIPEKWVMLPDDGKGDCEDYALAKMELLRRGGWPVVAYARIRGVMVGIGAHAILEILMPSGEIAFLDNGQADLMTRPELVAKGYKFYDW